MLQTLIPLLQEALRENGNVDVKIGWDVHPKTGEPLQYDDLGGLAVYPLSADTTIKPENERPTLYILRFGRDAS